MIKDIDYFIDQYLSLKSNENYDKLHKMLNMAYSKIYDYSKFLEILPKKTYSYKETKKEVQALKLKIEQMRRILYNAKSA